jgi:hypothetical protein
MLYRQHQGQQLGVTYRHKLVDKLRAHLSRHEDLYLGDLIVAEAVSERLRTFAGSSLSPAAIEALEGRERLMRLRTGLPKSRTGRVLPVTTALITGQYRRFGEGLGSGLKDMLL